MSLSAVTKLAAIKTVNATVTAIGAALASYTQLFSGLLYIGLGAAAVLLLITPILKKMM